MALTDAQILDIIRRAPNNLFELHPPQGECTREAQLTADKAFWDRVAALAPTPDVATHATARSATAATTLTKHWGSNS